MNVSPAPDEDQHGMVTCRTNHRSVRYGFFHFSPLCPLKTKTREHDTEIGCVSSRIDVRVCVLFPLLLSASFLPADVRRFHHHHHHHLLLRRPRHLCSPIEDLCISTVTTITTITHSLASVHSSSPRAVRTEIINKIR